MHQKRNEGSIMSGTFGCLGAIFDLFQLLLAILFRREGVESGGLPADQRPYDGFSQDDPSDKSL
jgi:hypothetical protein